MKPHVLVLVLLGATGLACSSEQSARGEGGLVFLEGRDFTKLDVDTVAFERDGNELLLRFALGGERGEGSCDISGYALGDEDEELGAFRLSAGVCEFTAGEAAWSLSAPSGQADYGEGGLSFQAEGDLLDEGARKGPKYQLMFDGTW